MAKNYLGPGDRIVIENEDVSGAEDIASGDCVLIGSLFGIAVTDIPVGSSGPIATGGEWEIPKTSAQAWAVGEKVYWNAGTGLATTTAGSNKQIGVATAEAANPSAIGRVLLSGAFTI